MSYQNIVVAISAGFQSQYGKAEADIEAVASEIIGQVSRMPDYLRLPIHLITFVFEWSGLVSGGRRFSSASAEARARQLLSWKNSPVGTCRNFVRFYESLFLLIAVREASA